MSEKKTNLYLFIINNNYYFVSIYRDKEDVKKKDPLSLLKRRDSTENAPQTSHDEATHR